MDKDVKAKRAPFVRASGDYIDVKFEDVIRILAMINDHGQLNELAMVAKEKQSIVRIPSQTINDVKEFIADNAELSRDPLGKKVLRPTKKKKVNVEGMPSMAARVSRGEDCCDINHGG